MALREEQLSHEQQELANLAVILAGQVDRGLQGAEQAQLGLIERMAERGIDTPEKLSGEMSTQDANRQLRSWITGIPSASALILVDTSGHVINTTRVWPTPPLDVTDIGYVSALTSDPKLISFISEPIKSRLTGAFTIYFARKFIAIDGQLLGFVVVAIELTQFEQAFSRMQGHSERAFVLYRRDGTLLARYPHVDPKLGLTFSNSDLYRRVLDAVDGPAVRLHSTMDGTDRVVLARSLDHFPLFLGVSDTAASILAPWRRLASMIAVGTCLFEALLGAALLFAFRGLRAQERRLQVVCEHADRELQALSDRFVTAMDNMRQGLCMFDEQNRLLLANKAFREFFCLSPDLTAGGTSYDSITCRAVDAGAVARDDIDCIRRRRVQMISQGKPDSFDWELATGRTLLVSHQPMQRGWLTTYEDNTERRKVEMQMAHMAHHDELTGLPNRVLFHDRVNGALANGRRCEPLALLYLDLDHFKTVNDSLGHPVGDELLKAVARRVGNELRETDTVARLGGDEFAIVQAPIGTHEDATHVARRIIDRLKAPFDIQGHRITIGVSIGVVYAPDDGVDPDDLMRRADMALYRAKIEGRGTYRLFQASYHEAVQIRRALEIDFREAVRTNQLEVHYQPFVKLPIEAISGFEALSRWWHPVRGQVPPSDFIQLAEDAGLIVPLGEWVMHQACADAMKWPGQTKVAVNLSPTQFKSPGLLSVVNEALSRSGLAPARLELEIGSHYAGRYRDNPGHSLWPAGARGSHRNGRFRYRLLRPELSATFPL
jgi:diguanylate cyclase (GGDEF)-like protein